MLQTSLIMFWRVHTIWVSIEYIYIPRYFSAVDISSLVALTFRTATRSTESDMKITAKQLLFLVILNMYLKLSASVSTNSRPTLKPTRRPTQAPTHSPTSTPTSTPTGAPTDATIQADTDAQSSLIYLCALGIVQPIIGVIILNVWVWWSNSLKRGVYYLYFILIHIVATITLLMHEYIQGKLNIYCIEHICAV
jgi:hypothetical protein